MQAFARLHQKCGHMPDIITPFDRRCDQRAAVRATDASRKQIPRRIASSCPSDPSTVWSALWRGARNKCPACGTSPLFGRFLKPVQQCQVCKEDWTRHNADDFPPYIVILVIGHVVVSGMAALEAAFDPPMWMQLAIWLPMVVVLAVGLIQPVKGGVIALQWWHRMGEFHGRRSTVLPEPATPDATAPSDHRMDMSLVIKMRAGAHASIGEPNVATWPLAATVVAVKKQVRR